MSSVQEVTPEVIDVPEVISGADRWLAEQRAKVAEIAKEYVPHEITSGEDYRESKRARAQARKAIKAVEDARRQQVGAIKDAVRDFEAQVRDLLTPLSGVDADYKAALAEWERLTIESRTQEVAAWYAETQGDVAAMVPFETIWQRYAHAEKWDLYGANLVQIEQDVAGVVESIEQDLATLDSAPYEPEDKAAVKLEYLRTLDLSGALRSADEARRRRERMAEVERQRAERMAEAERMAARAAETPEFASIATDATERPDEPQMAEKTAPVAAGGTVAYVVTVPRERVHDFAQAMRALGWAHGKRITDEQRREWESWQRA
ncbi:MAG: DUF1351 domain-containing protein [Parafannyhessea umbonata]|uniref:DUF1351 domain-containing protein n=1 Tax=Parafannyhessea umbonata TaxID=604330 RepID=UPI0026F1E4D2|nr:DUF1351 domain-containing protein [Parafannyhessea umbonata]MDD6565360.1 DUF1351 domain-containing protein [Parafannyhessea umbonata]